MNPANTGECWVRLRGWQAAYEVEVGSARIRSRDREVVDSLGRVRRLRGVELVQAERADGRRQVTLSARGHRRSFLVETLRRRALAHGRA